MIHPIYRVLAYEVAAPYTLKITFDDGLSQMINFEPILSGALYSPLRDLAVFNQVKLDPEIQTLVWPNGADFDPETLHNWQAHLPQFKKLAQTWQ